MIKQISIDSVATFTQPIIIRPKKINYFYGSNGSGKTTISNFIAEQSNKILWENEPIPTLVYNKPFIRKNFGETSEINGIFTLGENSKEAQEFISFHRDQIDECDKKLREYGNSQDTLIMKQQLLEKGIDDECWNIKARYNNVFPEALKGLNKSKNKFRMECLNAEKKKQSDIPNTEELKRIYNIVFGETRQIYSSYQLIDIERIVAQEKCELLEQIISGSDDTPISKFIEYLGNADWIKQGVPFAEKAKGKCPFCQQTLSDDLYTDIMAFFDDSYERALTQLEKYHKTYIQMNKAVLEEIRDLINNPIPFLDYSLLKMEFDTLSLLMDKNRQDIENKISSPSVKTVISSLASVLEKINLIIGGFNQSIDESNNFLKNQKTKQHECIDKVWSLIVKDLRSAIERYYKNSAGNKKGQNRLEELINRKKIKGMNTNVSYWKKRRR